MLQNIFKIAYRNLLRRKRSTLINVLGLSLGMTCFFGTILYAWHEFHYDAFHTDGDRLYRIEYSMDRGGENTKMGRIPPAIGPTLVDYFPEIEGATRFYPRALSVALPENQRQVEIEHVFFVDSTVQEIFPFDFLHGDAQRAFDEPHSLVLTDRTAEQLFGTTNVIGKPLTLAGEAGFQVTGVVKSWPDNAHLTFDMLLPFSAMIKVEPIHARENIQLFIESNWTATHSYTYVKLKNNQSSLSVNERFKKFIQEKGQEPIKNIQAFTLFPVRDIHLKSDEGGPKPPGNTQYLYLFLSIGLLTLLSAAINFINLSTASSLTRAREVGVRKVLGAERKGLIAQFLGESLLLSGLAFLLAIGMTIMALPYLNQLTGIMILPNALFNPVIIGIFVLIFLFTGITAGLYPAFFVSRFAPAEVLRGTLGGTRRPWNEWLRKGLITLQFFATITFIAGAITLYLQNKELNSRPLGFDPELTLALPLNSANNLNSVLRPGDATLRKRMNTFDESLLSNPNINAVTQCARLPGLGAIGRRLASDSISNQDNFFPRVLSVDYDFVETFDLTVIAGRDFDASFGTDHIGGFMINEVTMKRLGWDDPETAIGKPLNMEGKEGQVIGVLKDFHFADLRNEISPLLMEVRPGAFGYFAVKINNQDIPQSLKFIEDKWTAAFPEKVFEYNFLDETLQETYIVEQRLTKMTGYASLLAIFISIFGLFGLSSLLTQQRFKEITIRKILGASVGQILLLLSKDFMILILMAMLLATPLTWYFLQDWLSGFAYAIDFPWWVTLVSGLIVLIVALLTIFTQSIRAAIGNPVDAIRN